MNYANPIGYMKEIGKVHDIDCTEQLIGYSTAKFLLNTEKLETNIGKVSSEPYDKGTYLRVSGAIYDGAANYADILVGTDVGINTNNMFKRFNGKRVLDILSVFNDDSKLDAMDELQDAYTKIVKYKSIFAPIRVGSDCRYKGRDGFVLDTKVDVIKIEISKETRDLVYKIHLDNKVNTFRNITIPITEYGDTLFLNEVEKVNMNNESHVRRDLIRFTNLGYIKPIQINYGKSSLVIDNSMVYKLLDDYIVLVGYWSKDRFIIGDNLEEILKKPDYRELKDFLKSNIKYIKQHRTYIAPAFVVDHNVIDLNENIK